MASELKLALVILIIQFKLHGLNAAALSDRYKITASNGSSNSSNNNAYTNKHSPFDGSSFNEVYNTSINNNEIIDNATSFAVGTTTQATNINTNTTNDWQINNKHLLQLLPNGSSSEDFVVTGTADNAKPPLKETITLCDNDGKDSRSNCDGGGVSNALNIDTILGKSEKQKVSKSKSNFKNKIVNNSSAEDHSERENYDNSISTWQLVSNDQQQLIERTANNTDSLHLPQLKIAKLEDYYKYNFTQNDGSQAQEVQIFEYFDNEKHVDNATSDKIAAHEHQRIDKSGKLVEEPDWIKPDVWDTKGIFNELGDLVNSYEIEKILQKYKRDLSSHCIMDGIKSTIIWWSFANGTLNYKTLNNKNSGFAPVGRKYLDFSYQNIIDDNKLYLKTLQRQAKFGHNVLAFSAAHNHLKQIPFRTLMTMNKTLQLLTLKGNNFSDYKAANKNEAITRLNQKRTRNDNTTSENLQVMTGSKLNATLEAHDTQKQFSYRDFVNVVETEMLHRKKEGIGWATFPQLPHLIELDISKCNIKYIARDVFRNITGLRKLFISHNKMLVIPQDAFNLLPDLEYLDLSFTNLVEYDYKFPYAAVDGLWNLVYGVKIQKGAFKNLNKIIYLDLSHTMLTRDSAMAFTHLGQSLNYMSLCYTYFPLIGNALFKNTSLIGLDLSGNPYAAYSFIDDAFEGIAHSLQYLFFDQSNVKELEWLKPLENLNILSLAGNNINELSSIDFSLLKNLHVLDLSSNNIGNWYSPVFANNTELRVLNLHNNNINIINYEMLNDFTSLEYLSLGENNFICDCLLQDLVALAVFNSRRAECMRELLKVVPNEISEYSVNAAFDDTPFESLIPAILMKHYSMNSRKTYQNIHKYKKVRRLPRSRLLASVPRLNAQQAVDCTPISPTYSSDRLNDFEPKIQFQLVDFQEEDHYWCFNGTMRMQFMQLDCQAAAFGAIEENINKLTRIVVASTCSIAAVTFLIVIVYLKRWHIYYFYSSLKSAALLSAAAKGQVKKFDDLAESDPSMVYDMFISYCQSDRDWVLTELLPNVEEAANISICLHERDFQIGVAILENIISCMDRSRALMLIISSNFLLSHWCQFEMHLAQHRIFEMSKEHLIIVFLEDIPRIKRPKTLQYLMEVKTYIKWPGVKGREIKTEERKYFWKRLRRSLEQIGIPATESQA